MSWWREALGLAVGISGWPPPLPSADYYFLGGIADLVAPAGKPSAARPIVRLGPNIWAHREHLVIVRYLTEGEAAAVEARRWRSVHYIVDDLLPVAAASDELPADYRARLSRFVETMLPRILALGPVIVAPSRAIAEAFGSLESRRLDPCCLALCAGALPPPTPFEGRLEIGFLGTRSHLGSLPLLARLADRLEQAGCEARLHLYFGRHLPREIASSRTLVNHEPVPWPRFGAFCRRTKFHVALAPVQGTPFAEARSITKLMDHAAVGAAGVYGDRAPFAGVVTNGHDGLLLGEDAADWADAILRLAGHPARMADMAAAGAALAARLGDPQIVRRFWIEALAIDPSVA